MVPWKNFDLLCVVVLGFVTVVCGIPTDSVAISDETTTRSVAMDLVAKTVASTMLDPVTATNVAVTTVSNDHSSLPVNAVMTTMMKDDDPSEHPSTTSPESVKDHTDTTLLAAAVTKEGDVVVMTTGVKSTDVAGTTESVLGMETTTTQTMRDENRKEKRLSLDSMMQPPQTPQVPQMGGGGGMTCECDTTRPTFDPSVCPGKRIVADPSCQCRQKCVRQSGQACSELDPCDIEFGLACDKYSGVCQGKLQVQRSEVTHNSMVLRWKPSRMEELPQATVMYTTFFNKSNTRWMEADPNESMVKIDGLQPNTEYFVRIEENGHYEMAVVKTKDGCAVNGTVSFGLGETFHIGCQQTCTCMQSGKTECRERCYFRPGAISDPSCEEIVDENDSCCVRYQCKDNPVPNTPKVLVTQRTPSSLTIAWDDFKLPNYESGYVVEYRPVKEGHPSDWIQVQGENIPLMSVTRLKPHTAYQVRVSVWDDVEARTLGISSEVVTIFTEDGCVRNNQTFLLGAEFYEGCDLHCVCKGDDEGSCRERCSLPLLRAGAQPPEPHCVEVPVGEDPCCVMVRCPQAKSDVEAISYSEKPGLCPGEVETGDEEDCPTNCHHDHQCGGSMKCCQSSCGGSLCVEPFIGRNACEHVMCGPNAICINTEDSPSCMCFPGFTGEPTDLNKGCVRDGASGRSIEVCTYNNATYNAGDAFFDGCKYRCVCGSDLQVECHDRCSFSITDLTSDDPSCEVIADSRDPCCKALACESANTTVHNVSAPEIISEIGRTDGVVPTLATSEESTEHAITRFRVDEQDEKVQTIRPKNPTKEKEMSVTMATDGERSPSLSASQTTKPQDITSAVTIPVSSVMKTEAEEMPEKDHSHEDSASEMTTITASGDGASESDEVTTERGGVGGEDSHVTESEEEEKMMGVDGDLMHGSNHPEGHEMGEMPRIKEVPLRFNGCEHNNKTYTLGETFEDGCESRCLCDGRGHISCSPRCPPPADTGPKCREVPDPLDICCRITLCDAPGDRETVHSPTGLAIRLESAQPENSSAVILRINMQLPTSPGDVIQVWYAPIDAVNADKAVTWIKQKFVLGQLRLLEPQFFEVDLSGLRPSTDYYVKVVMQGMEPMMPSLYSNTVAVKTFPSAVKTTFKGCFHHNKTYDAGEVFYDGCDYRCVCHENGLLECRERCDIYIDTVGLEHCQWVPAPDDACCTVPYCGDSIQRAPLRPPVDQPHFPSPRDAFCIVGRGEMRPVGEKWEVVDGCRRQMCTCVLQPNGTTTVECKGGCPPIPSNVQHPTQDCPQPLLVTPEDPCLCPYIVCSNSVNPLSVPPPMCEYKGRRYHVGEEFYDSCRAVCHCGRDLRVNCAVVKCPQQFAPNMNDCLEWEEDPNFVPSPPNCCPQPRCKNDGSCTLNGHRFSNFQSIPQDLVDCSTRCVCVHGNVSCENRCPLVGDVPPPTLPCPPQMAYQGHLPGDTCCLHWMCRQSEKTGKELQNVSIISMNSTTIRVRFTLPALMVGLIGHAELHFTTDPTVPRNAWHVQKFARPKRLFDTANIEYYMSGLRPDTSYFFQVLIIVEALQGGPESEVFKLRMPSLPTTTTLLTTASPTATQTPTTSSPTTTTIITTSQPTTTSTTTMTTTTTTTTTTIPPMIMMDPLLSVTDIQSSSAKVSWRSFEPQEKKYIDGFMLKYKMADQKDGQWITTPMIHRDVTSFVLRDLKPSTSYMMDLVFVTSEGIPTQMVSTNPVEMRTGDLPKDEYNFHVSAHKEKIGPYGSDIGLDGVPEPLTKYVHVVKATYKTDTDAEQSEVFKVPKNNKISLESLKPGRRYKVWLDLYLTNGKTLSADVVEFMTKAAAPEARSNAEETGNSAEALQITHDKADSEAYYVALIVVAIVAAVAGLGFIVLLIILMRKQSSAKAPITRSPSESAYDNPTYKTYDGERTEDKNGTIQP